MRSELDQARRRVAKSILNCCESHSCCEKSVRGALGEHRETRRRTLNDILMSSNVVKPAATWAPSPSFLKYGSAARWRSWAERCTSRPFILAIAWMTATASWSRPLATRNLGDSCMGKTKKRIAHRKSMRAPRVYIE